MCYPHIKEEIKAQRCSFIKSVIKSGDLMDHLHEKYHVSWAP